VSVEEAALVAAAAAGSDEAFRRLVEPLRPELHAFCYRMLGSFHDAEDAVQDTQLKAWRALDRYEGRASFRSWMYRVASRVALDALRSRRRRVLPDDIGPARKPSLGLGEERRDIAWLEPYPDELLATSDPHAAVERRESIRLAFIRALQQLPPRQRAALILRDVLDWSAAEVAAALDTSVPAVNSALQRARASLRSSGAAATESVPVARDGDRAVLAARYVAAWEAGDIDAIVAMLTEDATHAMPPWSAWFEGRDALRSLYASYAIWRGRPGPGHFRILPTSLNGELGFAEYCRSERLAPYRALALTVVSLDDAGTRIANKVSFVRGDLMTAMGFPEVLHA
jgi:RNA polymerase sigma-70 factor (ECF subfamily)